MSFGLHEFVYVVNDVYKVLKNWLKGEMVVQLSRMTKKSCHFFNMQGAFKVFTHISILKPKMFVL
jgi:threonine dehydrogenase-like Zn-dependent dehydrogenase